MTTPSGVAVRVRDLRKTYGSFAAVDGITFDVARGEVFGFLGPNGSGKTTTIRLMCGLLTPDEGDGRVLGYDILRQGREIKREVGYMTQRFSLYEDLSVRENLTLPPVLAPGGLSDAELLETFPNLAERAASAGNRLSGGEQQMLAIARILRTGSRVVLLDEPSEGLAPVIVKEIGQAILRLKARGFTIILVEQNLRFARSVADRHVVVEHGRVADILTAAELEADLGRVRTYLGV